jgi:hypothetical protein
MRNAYDPNADIRPRRRAEPPPVPAWVLPRRRERSPRSIALSVIVHAAIIIAVVWRTSTMLSEGGGWGPGPAGGGGGGGPARRFVTLPAYAAPPPPAAPTPELPAVPIVPIPTAEVLPLPDLARIDVPQTQPSQAEGTTGGTGSGPGSGGGRGGGTGTGVGPGQGPGTGGDGSYILPAHPRGVILPPECAKGSFRVRFWVAADGRVTDIGFQPLPREVACRRDFEARMRGYRFDPAKTLDGVPVASVFQISIER